MRTRVLFRDGYECQLRLDCCTGLATTVDHIVPKSKGGRDTPANLQAACAPCNAAKGARV